MRNENGGRSGSLRGVPRAAGAAALGCLAAAGAARADVVTFDNANDLANNFTINVQTGTSGTTAGYPGYAAVSSGGASNSGAVDVTAGPAGTLDATAVYNKRSFDLVAGVVTLSQLVKVQAVGQTGDRLLQLGLIDDTASDRRMNGNPSRADFISARISPSAITGTGATTSAFTYQLQIGNAPEPSTTTTATSGPSSSAFNLTLGEWYLFTLNFSRTGTANTFAVDGSLQDFGTDGATPGTVVQTFAAQTISTPAGVTSDLYSDSTVFPAFRSFAAQGGADLLDTFTATQSAPVPEPTSLAVVALGGAGFLLRRRRAAR